MAGKVEGITKWQAEQADGNGKTSTKTPISGWHKSKANSWRRRNCCWTHRRLRPLGDLGLWGLGWLLSISVFIPQWDGDSSMHWTNRSLWLTPLISWTITRHWPLTLRTRRGFTTIRFSTQLGEDESVCCCWFNITAAVWWSSSSLSTNWATNSPFSSIAICFFVYSFNKRLNLIVLSFSIISYDELMNLLEFDWRDNGHLQRRIQIVD